MIYNKHINIDEVAAFAETCDSNTKLFIGCDSERFRLNEIWYADYITVVAVHVNGNNGCKIFGAVDRARDYDQRCDRPRMRLMNEVHRVSELYLRLVDKVPYEIEVHLDINPNEMHKSSIVINEAIGYIRGMCGVIPFVKPNAWAASSCADRYKEIVGHRRVA